jgi:hypothetical protein
MKSPIFFFLILLPSLIFADDYLETIQLPGNECFASVTVLRSGDILAAGVDFTSNDVLLMKTNASGVVLNALRISGSGEDEAQAVIATSDGGAVVIGSTSSFGEGLTDSFILKVRASGTLAWRRTFGTSGNEHFVKIVQTQDNGFIVLGDADHDPNLNDIVVTKFNSRGHSIWRKIFSGGSFDHASGLGLTSDNGAIVAVASDFPEGIRSLLVKFRADGTIEWSRIYGTSGNHLAFSAIQASDGGYYFTEIYTSSGSPTSRTVLSKLDSAGIPLWSRTYKSRGSNLGTSVYLNEADGSLVLAGNTTAPSGSNSRGVLIGLNQNGAILWRKRIKPDTRPVFIGQPFIESSDGSILVAGCAGERALNDMDILILKAQSNGNIQRGCSKLTTFPLSSARFNLPNSNFVVQEIPVPFFNASAGFSVASFSAAESLVCSGE